MFHDELGLWTMHHGLFTFGQNRIPKGSLQPILVNPCYAFLFHDRPLFTIVPQFEVPPPQISPSPSYSHSYIYRICHNSKYSTCYLEIIINHNRQQKSYIGSRYLIKGYCGKHQVPCHLREQVSTTLYNPSGVIGQWVGPLRPLGHSAMALPIIFDDG